MSERIHTYTDLLHDAQGQRYRVHVDGQERSDGTWEGWVRFEPHDGALPALQTGRETTQSNRADLEYWASGLEVIYLEGGLARARPIAAGEDPTHAMAREPEVRPARESPTWQGAEHAPARAVLDPYAVYVQGEDVLREELNALDAGHLRNIVRAYGLADEEQLSGRPADRGQLAEVIVSAVRERVRER